MAVIDGNTLDGVSATTLWTLHNRATEAMRPGGAIVDPYAVRLYQSIAYDYLKFGAPNQSHALRAVAFDRAATAYLRTHPRASVVALAEGLQTSFWRLDAAGVCDEVTWYSVDLPPVMALREQLLPHDDRIIGVAQSALDLSWLDRIDPADGVFVTAEGLLMYLVPDDVRTLIGACAARLAGGQFMFDSIPAWLSRRTLKGWQLTKRYRTPAMPFGIDTDSAKALAGQIPGVAAGRDIPHVPGRGVFRLFATPALDRIGPWRRARPSMTLLDFG